jgi:hypothetical protein
MLAFGPSCFLTNCIMLDELSSFELLFSKIVIRPRQITHISKFSIVAITQKNPNIKILL